MNANDHSIRGRAARSVDDVAIRSAANMMHMVAEVSGRLKLVASTIENIVQSASAGGELTLTHWLILANLSQVKTTTQSRLQSESGIAVGYLTRRLDELEMRGMIWRYRSKEDRRQVLLGLTNRGKGTTRSLLVTIDQAGLFRMLNNLKWSLDHFLLLSGPEK